MRVLFVATAVLALLVIPGELWHVQDLPSHAAQVDECLLNSRQRRSPYWFVVSQFSICRAHAQLAHVQPDTVCMPDLDLCVLLLRFLQAALLHHQTCQPLTAFPSAVFGQTTGTSVQGVNNNNGMSPPPPMTANQVNSTSQTYPSPANAASAIPSLSTFLLAAQQAGLAVVDPNAVNPGTPSCGAILFVFRALLS